MWGCTWCGVLVGLLDGGVGVKLQAAWTQGGVGGLCQSRGEPLRCAARGTAHHAVFMWAVLLISQSAPRLAAAHHVMLQTTHLHRLAGARPLEVLRDAAHRRPVGGEGQDDLQRDVHAREGHRVLGRFAAASYGHAAVGWLQRTERRQPHLQPTLARLVQHIVQAPEDLRRAEQQH